MRTRVLLITLVAICLVPLAHAQITLTTLVGTTQTPVTNFYNYPSIAPNATLDVTFVATNTGTTNVFLAKLALSGIGFAIVNYETWGAYKNFALSLAPEAASIIASSSRKPPTHFISRPCRSAWIAAPNSSHTPQRLEPGSRATM